MNPAELVMNCPDLRNLILSHRTESMIIDEQNKTKNKMRMVLNFLPSRKIVNDEYTCYDASAIFTGYYGPPEYYCYAYDRKKGKTYMCSLGIKGWEFCRNID